MEPTRRDFLERGIGSITVLGFSLFKSPGGESQCEAAEPELVTEIPVIWLATGACTGCSVSLLNAASPTVRFLLVGNVLPGQRLSLAFHSTLMAAAGDLAMDTLSKTVEENKGQYLLVIDGATAAKDDGVYCTIGERDGQPITGYQHVRDLGRNARAVLAAGACAAFGGIPAADPNPTGCMSVAEIFKQEHIDTPVVNVPGCPPHPDWIIGTIATILLGGLDAVRLDEHRRPKSFFGQLVHDNCPYRGHFDRGEFAEQFGQHGCLIKLGCKGPITHADCPIRRWNNGTSWCVQAGHPCIGCCEPDFPFEGSMFKVVEPAQLTFPATYPSTAEDGRKQADAGTYTTIGLIGVGGFMAGMGVTAAARKLNSHQPPLNDRSGSPGMEQINENHQ